MTGRRATDRTFDHPDHVRDFTVSVHESGEVDGIHVERDITQRWITFREYHFAIIAAMIAAAMIGGAFVIGVLVGVAI